MITGEDPQTTGVVRQDLGDPELHREVGDSVGQTVGFDTVVAGRLAGPGGALLVPQRPGQVVVEFGSEGVETLDERFVAGELLDPRRADLPEHRDGIASDVLPDLGIDGLEQVLGRFVP